MDDEAARALLGVAPDAPPEVIRLAYRRLLRSHHPDLAGASISANRRTAELNQAYVLVTKGAVDERPADDSPPSVVPAAAIITMPSGTSDVFDRLCQAADTIGTLAYVGRADEILETIIEPEGGPPCSLMIALERHGDETLAQCTLEPLDARPGPPIEGVVGALSEALHGGQVR